MLFEEIGGGIVTPEDRADLACGVERVIDAGRELSDGWAIVGAQDQFIQRVCDGVGCLITLPTQQITADGDEQQIEGVWSAAAVSSVSCRGIAADAGVPGFGAVKVKPLSRQ